MAEEKIAEKVKYIVRIASTDLDGKKPLAYGLLKIKGISKSFANAVCAISKVDKQQKIGSLDDAQIKRIDEVVRNPKDMPTWMLNRRRDYETGENMHLISGDLSYSVENDIKRQKMIKSRVGLRHSFGLPVRGQRTKSNHRRSKRKKSAASKRPAKKEGPQAAA